MTTARLGDERLQLINRAKKILPSHIPVDPPVTAEQALAQQAECAKRFKRIMEPLPAPVPLDAQETETRSYRSHHEIKLTYMAEADDPVPAYLLVPNTGKPPYPAIVAHHQCNVDCDLGKDAVVGKVVDRPDQAYALELVRRGFVVLAPDTKSCGERPARGFRKLGECRPQEPNFKVHHCYWGRHIGVKLQPMTFTIKQVYDSMRAVDYLTTRTDLIDPNRIGMIGHSQGAGITQLSLALDERVRAGVSSCGSIGGFSRSWLTPKDPTPEGELRVWMHEHYASIAPRALLCTNGRREGWLSDLTEAHYFPMFGWAFDYARYVAQLLGYDSSCLQDLAFDGQHSFPDEVRQRSYEFLAQQLAPVSEKLALPAQAAQEPES